jgi:SNF2 family DNA or RNA helicase
VRRELLGEIEQARALFDKLPTAGMAEGPPQCFTIDEPDRALEIVAALQDPPAGLEAQWVDARQFVRGAASVDQLRVKVERKRDWFGITGELKIDGGRLELAILLDAARRQQRFVRVDPNRWIELTAALQERLLAISDQAYVGRDQHIELSPGAAPAIRALLEAGAKVDAATSWEQLTERLVGAKRLRPKPPATLRATLRDYQVEGHAWLARLAAWGTGACLADDMGLGKTVQAIALLLDRARLGPALVLAPTSVSFNWVDELRRFAPTLRPILYTDSDRTAGLGKLGKRDVVIATYGLLVNDADKLAATKFATLVVDEAQALKNPNTRRARAARMLDADFRVALSGTPFENHLGELWSLFSVIFPGLLGSWDQFRDRYAVPIERDKNADARAALSRVLRPFLLRRTKQEVARELPARTEIEVPVALSDDEHTLYEDARLAALAELATKDKSGMQDQRRRFQVLAALTRLRLLASHPKLYDGTSTVPSSKLARAVELLEELRAEGHRALVFSQFTSHLALVREALDARSFRYLYLDGSTPAAERGQLVRRFQEGTFEVFLISLKAGGQGINLTAADYIVHLDPWWNPAVEDQATDRAHRIGQTKPVTVYRLIARGTIEEQILALHREKRALVAGILEGSDIAGRMTTRDLMALLQAPTR